MGNLFSVNGLFGNNYMNDIDINKMPSIDGSENARHSLLSKEYGYVYDVLTRNIGSHNFGFDTYGAPIGRPAVIEWYKSSPFAWFNRDPQKLNTYNYIDYANTFYYGNEGGIDKVGFLSQWEKEAILTPIDVRDYHVGVIHSWRRKSNPNMSMAIDTSLGSTNAFYTELTLSTSAKNEIVHDERVTENAYAQFGISGDGDFSVGGMLDSIFIEKRIDENALLPKDYPKINWNNGLYLDNFSNSQILFEKSSEFTKRTIKQNLKLNTNNLEWEEPMDYLSTMQGKIYNYNLLSGINRNGVPSKDFRYGMSDRGRENLQGSNVVMYAEQEGSSSHISNIQAMTGGTADSTYHDKYTAYGTDSQIKDIISYTAKNFDAGKYGTMISRFASNTGTDFKPTEIQGAVTKKWEMSHGRNLLKHESKRSTKDNGYQNPYCRVWTYHHQYAKYSDLIRPFNDIDTDLYGNNSYKTLRTEKGLVDYKEYGVLDKKTGLPRIAPTQKRRRGEDLRNLMFSIENLAWKNNVKALEKFPGQKGPNGGRIMWFPPYGLKFNENVDVQWQSTQFLGRGENVYTYTNTERSGSLDFILLIDHPSIINKWQNALIDEEDEDALENDGSPSLKIEQGLLRFFAGCDILDPSTQDKKQEEKKNDSSPQNNPPKSEVDTTPPNTIGESFTFNVFFPNNYSGNDDTATDAIYYLINGIGSQMVTTTQNPYNPNVITNDMSHKTVDLSYDGIGYEMTKDSGLTYFATSDKFKTFTLPNFTTNKDTKKRWLTATVKEDGITWGKLGFRSDTLVSFQQMRQKDGGAFVNAWGYRCDKKYQDQILQCRNYVDLVSYQLNSKNYQDAYNKTKLGFTDEMPENLYSLSDVFYVLDNGAKNWNQKDQMTNDSNVKKLENIIETEGFKITNVEIVGHASRHGYEKLNVKLANDRAQKIWEWMQESNALKGKIHGNMTFKGMSDFQSKDDLLYDINSFVAKVWRSATVTVKYEISNVTKGQEVSQSESATNVSKIDNDEVARIQEEASSNGKEFNSVAYRGEGGSPTNTPLNQTHELADLVVEGYYEDKHKGYYDEYEYFRQLERDEPFLHHRIIDKIKYFDPAFHSISPEGFNARLTFLQQCTRAGSTNSASEADGSGLMHATNLAYGAPPVCVLKIGDFIHTKIIIQSLNISYDDGSWDLNPEGIGVMPMIANVSIGFKYIGSQSLSKPIARLGNALSFNYYANTEVYDERSELYPDTN